MTFSRLHIEKRWWINSVIVMRIACPINLAFALYFGTRAIEYDHPSSAAIDFFCAGVTLALGFINWVVYRF